VSDLRSLLEIQAILPETSPFLSAQMAVLSGFFQMFIVLGMYNFASLVEILQMTTEFFKEFRPPKVFVYDEDNEPKSS
jgi:hypothetical protein